MESLNCIANDKILTEDIYSSTAKESMDKNMEKYIISDGSFQRKNVDESFLKAKRRRRGSSEDNMKEKKQNPSVEDKQSVSLRRNIRDVLNIDQLDVITLAAQREESERLARVAEKQKCIKEIQIKQNLNKLFFRNQRVLSTIKDTDLSDKSANNFSRPFDPNTPSKSGLNDDNFEKNFKDNKTLSQIEVVTIEDSSSDDDCILVSDTEDTDEEDDLTECNDAGNSGIHVKDAYNTRDECGRVVVNIGHPDEEENIYLAPQIAKIIKPHQIGGVRFLYDNIIESITRFTKSSGFGCILAHSMGLGKTLQVVSFCDIFLRHTKAKNVLCVMPINTLQNWLMEFNMWIPATTNDPTVIRPRNFGVFVVNDQQKSLTARAKVILKWAEDGGVLLIGYELFRLLALKIVPTRKKRSFDSNYGENRPSTNLIDKIHQALVKPGPDLIICDEGHRIKNAHAGISIALKQIQTRRRVVLTGYPLQNNLQEYWCMVDFVRPNYLGSKTEFCNMFERPIQNGQCADSTPADIKLMRYRAHVLHSLLVGFVQRRSHEVLQKTLPTKLEYVILVKMSDFQRSLYDTFMTDVRKKTFPNPLKAFAVCCKIWNHPDVLYNYWKKSGTEMDLEIDEEVLKISTPNKMQDETERDKIMLKPLTSGERQANCIEPFTKSTVSELDLQCDKQEIGVNCDSNIQSNGFGLYNTTSDNKLPNSEEIEIKSSSYWLNPVTPNYVGMTVQKSGHDFTKDLESPFEESQIVDLDTKEIKTVECDLRGDCFLDSKASPKKSNSENKYQKAGINVNVTTEELQKKPQKQKKNDELSCVWAIDLMKNYQPGLLSNSPKMCIFFSILKWSVTEGERVLLFSQSLLTLDLVEHYLRSMLVPGHMTYWIRNSSYFRLDGSTSSQEREKLVCEFNSNNYVKLFLISTRAGSLGINLTGANRVVIFDASWNPCHDTQAVYRIYRYGQQKQCYIYRLVMDKCLEKKIYDRQIKKQGMSNRVVDECNPEAHLSMRDSTNLCIDYESDEENIVNCNEKSEDPDPDNGNITGESKSNPDNGNITGESKSNPDNGNITGESKSNPLENKDVYYDDPIVNKIIEYHKDLITKLPFFHESLLIDRKERKLSQAEKRQAHRSYEMEKKASVGQKPGYFINRLQSNTSRTNATINNKPVASIRPMQAKKFLPASITNSTRSTKWIPAEVWQRQGLTSQEMILPLDVVIPTNCLEKSDIILKAGQRVMVLKSGKGIYMQLESGKIIAIRTNKVSIQENRSSDNKIEVIDITADSEKDDKKKDKVSGDEKVFSDDVAIETVSGNIHYTSNMASDNITSSNSNFKNIEHKEEKKSQTHAQTHENLPLGNFLPKQSHLVPEQQNKLQEEQISEQPLPQAHQCYDYSYKQESNAHQRHQPEAYYPPYNLPFQDIGSSSQYYTSQDTDRFTAKYRNLYDIDSSIGISDTNQIANYVPPNNIYCPPYSVYMNDPSSYANNSATYFNSNIFQNQTWNQNTIPARMEEAFPAPLQSYADSSYHSNH